jgi:hypothetical protein
MHQGIYHKFVYINFKTNLKNLHAAIKKQQGAAEEDEVALACVFLTWEPQVGPVYPPWHNSEAKRLLLEDLQSGAIQNVKPKELWQMRPEYAVYPLDTFRDHLNKEKKKPIIKAYWEHQKSLKKLKKEGGNSETMLYKLYMCQEQLPIGLRVRITSRHIL